jgi:hypothetical protein
MVVTMFLSSPSVLWTLFCNMFRPHLAIFRLRYFYYNCCTVTSIQSSVKEAVTSDKNPLKSLKCWHLPTVSHMAFFGTVLVFLLAELFWLCAWSFPIIITTHTQHVLLAISRYQHLMDFYLRQQCVPYSAKH